jgi:hypothetical protein
MRGRMARTGGCVLAAREKPTRDHSMNRAVTTPTARKRPLWAGQVL